MKGFGKQIAENPLFSTISEDFIKALYAAANAYDFGDSKFQFVWIIKLNTDHYIAGG